MCGTRKTLEAMKMHSKHMAEKNSCITKLLISLFSSSNCQFCQQKKEKEEHTFNRENIYSCVKPQNFPNWLKSFGRTVVAAACLLRDPLFCLIFPTTYTFHFPTLILYTFYFCLILVYFILYAHILVSYLPHHLYFSFPTQLLFPSSLLFLYSTALVLLLHCSLVQFPSPNFFGLRKPSDTFLPEPQHQTAVSQYSTTLGFYREFLFYRNFFDFLPEFQIVL